MPKKPTKKAGKLARSAQKRSGSPRPTRSHRPISSAPPPRPSPTLAERTCAVIERTLGRSRAFRKIEDRLYVVHQGSTYVTINVINASLRSSGTDDKPVVRVCAQVASGVRPEPSLFRQLLILNASQRFGAFAYLPDGDVVLFFHSMLGGEHMDEKELVATVGDIARIADSYDDRIVARYGGRRMQDVVEESAMARIMAALEEDPTIKWEGTWDGKWAAPREAAKRK